MHGTRKLVIGAITVAALVGIAPLLSACVSPQAAVENAVENAIEDATGGNVDINASTNTLPDGWPASVPTVSGTITTSASFGADGATTWTVSIDVADAKAAYEQAKSQLAGAGMEETLDSSSGGIYSGLFSNAEYSLILTGDSSTTPQTINYVLSNVTVPTQ